MLFAETIPISYCRREKGIKGRVFDSGLFYKQVAETDQVLTPQQQCLLLFSLRLPVDQATSKIPPLRERC